MAFEVLWSRALVFFLTSTTYAFTTVLSVMLAGLTVGALIAVGNNKRTPRSGHMARCAIALHRSMGVCFAVSSACP